MLKLLYVFPEDLISSSTAKDPNEIKIEDLVATPFRVALESDSVIFVSNDGGNYILKERSC